MWGLRGSQWGARELGRAFGRSDGVGAVRMGMRGDSGVGGSRSSPRPLGGGAAVVGSYGAGRSVLAAPFPAPLKAAAPLQGTSGAGERHGRVLRGAGNCADHPSRPVT
jgi:hypothetical protein